MAKNKDGLTIGAVGGVTLENTGTPIAFAEDVRGGGIGNYTTTERDAIDGRILDNHMIIYNTTDSEFQVYSGGTRNSSGFLSGGSWAAFSTHGGGGGVSANDATITLTAGSGLTGGGDFTTNQGTDETITFNLDTFNVEDLDDLTFDNKPSNTNSNPYFIRYAGTHGWDVLRVNQILTSGGGIFVGSDGEISTRLNNEGGLENDQGSLNDLLGIKTDGSSLMLSTDGVRTQTKYDENRHVQADDIVVHDGDIYVGVKDLPLQVAYVSGDSYDTDDTVTRDNKLWVSTVDSNTAAPTTDGVDGWAEVTPGVHTNGVYWTLLTTDLNTTYTAGTGLDLTGTEFSVDTTTIATREYADDSPYTLRNIVQGSGTFTKLAHNTNIVPVGSFTYGTTGTEHGRLVLNVSTSSSNAHYRQEDLERIWASGALLKVTYSDPNNALNNDNGIYYYRISKVEYVLDTNNIFIDTHDFKYLFDSLGSNNDILRGSSNTNAGYTFEVAILGENNVVAAIGDLNQVDISSPSGGDYLVYNSSHRTWENKTGLGDINVSSDPSPNAYLKQFSSGWGDTTTLFTEYDDTVSINANQEIQHDDRLWRSVRTHNESVAFDNSAAYVVDNSVRFGGIRYHVTTAVSAPVVYAVTSTYADNSYVLFENHIYKANSAVNPPNAHDFGTSYTSGNLVLYNGVVYEANANVSALTEWVSGTTYTSGDVVYHNGVAYSAANDITNSTTAPADDSTNWTPLPSLNPDQSSSWDSTDILDPDNYALWDLSTELNPDESSHYTDMTPRYGITTLWEPIESREGATTYNTTKAIADEQLVSDGGHLYQAKQVIPAAEAWSSSDVYKPGQTAAHSGSRWIVISSGNTDEEPSDSATDWANVDPAQGTYWDEFSGSDTTYTAGTGLTLTGSEFAVSQSYVDGRVEQYVDVNIASDYAAPNASATDSIAIGPHAAATTNAGAIAIGDRASATGHNSLALGRFTDVGNSHTNSVAIGNSAATEGSNEIRLGNSVARVTVDEALAGAESADNQLVTKKYVDSRQAIDVIDVANPDEIVRPVELDDYVRYPLTSSDHVRVSLSISGSHVHYLPLDPTLAFNTFSGTDYFTSHQVGVNGVVGNVARFDGSGPAEVSIKSAYDFDYSFAYNQGPVSGDAYVQVQFQIVKWSSNHDPNSGTNNNYNWNHNGVVIASSETSPHLQGAINETDTGTLTMGVPSTKITLNNGDYVGLRVRLVTHDVNYIFHSNPSNRWVITPQTDSTDVNFDIEVIHNEIYQTFGFDASGNLQYQDLNLSGDPTNTIVNQSTRQIPTGAIEDNAITNAKIADDAVDSDQIADGAIDTVHIADDQVTFAKMQNIGNNTILGRVGTGSGDVEALSGSQAASAIGGGVAAAYDYFDAVAASGSTLVASSLGAGAIGIGGAASAGATGRLNNIAIGAFASANADPAAMAIGAYAEATGTYSIAIGSDESADDGFHTEVTGASSIGIGRRARVDGDNSFAIGENIHVTADNFGQIGNAQTQVIIGRQTQLGDDDRAIVTKKFFTDNSIANYDAEAAYEEGAHVFYNNSIYISQQAISALTTQFSYTENPGIGAERIFEDLRYVSTGQALITDTFGNTEGYSTGDIVVYDGVTYIALNDITAGVTNPNPPDDATNWAVTDDRDPDQYAGWTLISPGGDEAYWEALSNSDLPDAPSTGPFKYGLNVNSSGTATWVAFNELNSIHLDSHDGANASGTDAIAIGGSTTASGSEAIALGQGTGVSGNNSAAIGPNISVTTANTMIIGGNDGDSPAVQQDVLLNKATVSGDDDLAVVTNAYMKNYVSDTVDNATFIDQYLDGHNTAITYQEGDPVAIAYTRTGHESWYKSIDYNTDGDPSTVSLYQDATDANDSTKNYYTKTIAYNTDGDPTTTTIVLGPAAS